MCSELHLLNPVYAENYGHHVAHSENISFASLGVQRQETLSFDSRLAVDWLHSHHSNLLAVQVGKHTGAHLV